MTRRPVRGCVVLALLLCAGLLAGCDREPPKRGQLDPVEKGDKYVALGDSYVSGPNLGQREGNPGCRRTKANYPHLVAEELGLELVDASCGGAATDDLTGSQSMPLVDIRPQLEAVTKDAAVVTLGIGANDEELFAGVIFACTSLARTDPDGTPCTDLAEREGTLDGHEQELRERIGAAVEEIEERAPRARVVLVGYPQIFPASGQCDQLPLAPGDYPFAHGVLELLNSALRKAAEDTGVEYLDQWEATAGHDICSDDPWMAGVKPTEPAAPYHSYAKHQEVVADLLADLLSQRGRA